MKTGKLKERRIKLVVKNYGEPDKFLYAEAGEAVRWDGGRAEHPEHYGGREVLWCTLHSGESIGLEYEEVEWDDER